MVGRTLPAGGGTATISAHYVTAACDKKSLPTTVHVRPSNINCNSLRADFSLTKYNPTVLLGWVVHATPLRPCCWNVLAECRLCLSCLVRWLPTQSAPRSKLGWLAEKCCAPCTCPRFACWPEHASAMRADAACPT